MQLELSSDEALVLFELISRMEKLEARPWSEAGEQEVIWRIEGQLEKVLLEPFQSNYKELVSQAREQVAKGGRK